MSYTQKWDLQKSGSDWSEKNEAVADLQTDMDDITYVSQTLSHPKFEEFFMLDVLNQTLRYERDWELQSDCEAYVASNIEKDAELESKLTEAGWTMTVV